MLIHPGTLKVTHQSSSQGQGEIAQSTSPIGHIIVDAKFGSCGDLLRAVQMRGAMGTFALFVAILLLASNGGILVIVAAVCCLVIYLSEAFTCELSKQFPDMDSVDEALLHLEELKKNAPVHWWSIQNYHEKDSNVRVLAHFEKGEFAFQKWNDHSPPLRGAHDFDILELNMNVKSYCANPLTKQQYEYQASEFQLKHQVETCSDFKVGVELKGIRERTVCMDSGSFLLSAAWYFAFSFFGLSLFYRLWAHSKTGVAHYTFVKEVFSDPSAPTHIKYKSQPLTASLTPSDVFYSPAPSVDSYYNYQ